MKRAIEKAVYYSDNSNNNRIISTFQYSDKEDFFNILLCLNNNIEIISLFAPKDDICYSIFNNLYYCYDSLLFGKTTSILLINRKDFCIKLIRNTNENINTNEMETTNENTNTNTNEIETNTNENTNEMQPIEPERIAILKIDSIMMEYLSYPNFWSYIMSPSLFLMGCFSTYFFLKKD